MANKYFVFILAFLGYSVFYSQKALAQEDKAFVEIADEAYKLGAKREAGEQYREAIKLNPNNIRANYMAGVCYLETIKKEKAIKFLLKAYQLDPNYTPDILFLIAKAYHLGEQFDKASYFYNLYKEDVKTKTGTVYSKDKASRVIGETDKRIGECKNGKDLTSRPVYIKIESVGNGINSEEPEYAPAISGDESVMIFTARRSEGISPDKANDNRFYEDIFISKKTDNKWSYLENIGNINTLYHDASISLSSDGKQLLLYKDENAGDIFVSKVNKDKKWSTPKSVGNNINSEFKESSASISPDGKLLFFSSDRPGGLGGIDIYVSPLLKGDKWGAPSNLGPKINTPYDDDSPVLDFDGKTLYFSSKGQKGMGGYDLFKSEYDSTRNEWTDPINLGYPINTSDDDTYYVIAANGKRAYYASVKDNMGEGDLDIFMLTVPETPEDSLLAKKLGKKKVLEDAKDIKEIEKQLALSFPAEPEQLAENTSPAPKALIKEQPKVEQPVEEQPKVEQAVAEQPKVEEPVTEQPIAVAPTNLTASAEPEVVVPKEVPIKTTPVKDEPVVNSLTEAPIKKEPVKAPAAVLQPVSLQLTVIGSDGQPIDANVQLTDLTNNKTVNLSNSSTGTYLQEFTNNKQRRYSVSIEKEGYMFKNVPVIIPASNKNKPQEITKSISLSKVAAGQKMQLRNIYFDFDNVTLKKESHKELEKLVRLMNENSASVIQISGHTDKIGSWAYNKNLSQRRAESVVKYLISKGIDASRLRAVGYGAEKPLASNDDEQDGRELNRRTEFEVLSN